jgi:hypothetical protein
MIFLKILLYLFFPFKTKRRMRGLLLSFPLILLILSCNSNKNGFSETKFDNYIFSPNKIWAHRVNCLKEVELKHQQFEGLEIDLIYSKMLNDFYVAHNDRDTLLGVMLEDWIMQIPNPEKNWYWFDLKNLNNNNAEDIVQFLVNILNKHEILHKTICESRKEKALYVLKKEGLAVCLWVSRDDSFRNTFGNAFWKRKIKRKIAFLKPDALSCSAQLHPLLDSTFTNENITYWNTPIEDINENIKFTKKLCNIPNVKVIFVDYDEPIKY